MWGKIIFYNKIFFISRNFEPGEGYGQKTNFGVPVLDCLYLFTGALPNSENQVIGVFLSKFFAAGKENPKNGQNRAKKIFLVFGFLEKSRRKIKISKNPENFTIKIIFCARFVLSKLFCSSNKKKVTAKTKIWKSQFWSPVAGPQGAEWPNEGDLGGFWVETNLLMKCRQNRSREPDYPLYWAL